MKVTIVQGAFLPVPPVVGGAVEKLWSDLGQEFARRGLDITHVSRRWPTLPVQGIRSGVQEIRVRGFDYPRPGLRAKLMDLVYSIRCISRIGKSDVVITNTFFLPILLSLISPVSNRGKIYVSVHRFPRGQMHLYQGVKRLQCVSTSVANAVREQSPKVAHLVHVIPNYVAQVLSRDEILAEWPLREKIVLFVGRLHAEKGVDILIEAFGALPPLARRGWRVRIVGPYLEKSGGGGASYLASLQALATSHDIEVEWVGPIFDREKLNDEYRRASIFVYPSIAAEGEAFPLAPLEAMAMGCPAITSDLSCFDDYIRPGENAAMFSVSAPLSAGSLSKELYALISEPALRKTFSMAGLATASRFTLSRIADLFVEDFRALSAPNV